MPNVYEQVKQALQDVVAPELKGLQIEIRRLDEKIDSGLKRLDEKIDSKHDELLSEIRRLDEKIDSKHNEVLSEIRRLDGKIDSLDDKIELGFEFRDRFTALETKVDALSSR